MTQTPFLPVPVQNRADGWTPEKQWKFVEALARTSSITQAARTVNMSARSAHRLRNHPEAAEFRAAWDAALRQAWGLLEQVALDRAVNGERETITRDGFVVAERSKPCSDRLLMFLLSQRERSQAAARAERAAAHRLALEAARLAAIEAGAAAIGRRRGAAPAPPVAPPPPPVLVDAAAAETAALRAFHARADAFTPWPELDEDILEFAPIWARNNEPSPEASDDAPAPAGFDFESRPRWEDHPPATGAAPRVRQPRPV